MEEVVAPSDYVTLETTLDFTITNGVISSTNTDEHYTVTPASDGDGNLIVMKDDALPNAPLEILKLDENGDPLADAEFTLESKTIRDKIKSNESISGSEFYELRALSSVDISDLDEAFEANYLSELVTIDRQESGGISMEITYGVKWKSSSESAFILSGLPDGEYILTEITPPNGYVPLDPLTFTIDKGNVQLPEGTNENIYAVDATNSMKLLVKNHKWLSISKLGTGSKEVADAEMTFSKVLVDDITEEVSEDTSFESTTWTSEEGKSKEIDTTDLEDGYYLLHEEVAPDTYTLATDIYVKLESGKITGEYTLTADNTLEEVTAGTHIDTTANKITMTDTLSVINISKKEVAASVELSGAKLTLTLDTPDVEGATLEGVTLTGGGTDVTKGENSISWTSGNTSAILTGLPDGTYTLEEEAVPKDEDDNETHVQAEALPLPLKMVL